MVELLRAFTSCVCSSFQNVFDNCNFIQVLNLIPSVFNQLAAFVFLEDLYKTKI